ncbi:MAG: large repetitive protein, partial [Frankiaceae bacterium]|nr:large repetitive protein [Frankiaceae bacterium]
IDGTTALATGTYTAQAQQSDNNGNIGYSAPHTFTVDATPPSITLTTPANNSSTNDTTPTLSGTAGIASGDLSGVTVTIYNGSNTLGTVAQTPTTTRNGTTGAYTLDATALLPGTYTAQASQLDGAGNVGTSNTRTFTIDTTAPVVTLTTPANGSSTNDTTPTYSGTAGQLTGDQTAITVEIYSGTTVTGSPLQTRPATAAAGAWTVDGTTALLPGTYTARALQTDAAGNQGTSTPNTFTVDTTAPVLTLTTPANGNRTNVTTPTYSGAAGNATGDSATVTLDIYSGSTVTGSPVQSRPATRVGATWTIDGSPALTAGTYTARATQTDAAGNSGHSGDNTFVVDTTAPTITLTAPANASSTPDNTPTFSGVAGITTGDNAAVAVKVYAGTGTGGTLLQTLNATRNGTTGAYTVDASSGLPDGTYTAQASQDDSAGNTGNSSANTFTVNGPPVVTLTTPADGAVLGTHTPSIGGARGTAAGDLQTVTVHIYSGTGTGGTEVQTPTDSGSGSTWGVTPTSLADGTYTVQATQSDGSLTGTSAAHTFRVDTTAPNVAITAPADGSRISDATPAISGTAGTATGDASTVSVKLYNGTGTGGTLLQTLTPTVGGTGGWTTSATTLPQGTYTAQATQSDNASPANTGTSTPVTFTVDTTAPTVTLATPPTTRSTDTTPTFSGTGSTDPTDNPTVTVRVFSGTSASGSAVQTFTPTLSGGNYTVDSPGLGNGTYTAQTSQGDQAGNVGHSTSRTFTVDTAAPSVTLTAPADGSSSTESSPTFSGAAGTAAGDNSGVTVKVFSGSAPSGSALQTLSATQSGGAWSVPASAPLAPGTYTAQAEQSDDMGHTGKSSANTFTITAPVVVTPPPSNNAPACTNGTANVPNATATSVTLSCTDGDGDPLTLSIVSGPGHGTVGAVDQAAKSVTYTPASAFSGADSFTFKANDGKADSNAATISLTVAAPVVIPPGAIGKAIKLPPPGIIKTVLNGNTPASANFGTGVCPPACFIVIQLFPAGQAPTTAKASPYGKKSFRVAPGKKVPLTVKLTKKATAQLKKKGKLKITAVIKTVDAAGHTTTIRRNYTLKVTKKR